MNRDLEEFLRKAAQRRKQRPAQPKAGQPVKPRSLQPIEIIEADVVVPHNVSGDDVAAHVAQHLDASGFAKRADALGDAVEQLGDKAEAHRHEVFDHGLGQLNQSAPAAKAAQQTTKPMDATGIAALLRTPQSVRQAIVLSEILSRPEHRW